MTVTPEAPPRTATATVGVPAAPADSPIDPRINPLLDLVQALLNALGDIGTNYSAAIQDPDQRRKVIAHAEENTRLCRSRLNKILETGV